MGEVWPGAGRGRYRVELLGRFHVSADGQPLEVPVGTQRLISKLALRGACGRSRLAGLLWPETTEAKALASLRTAIWRAGRIAPGLLLTGHDDVSLASDVEVDVSRLVEMAHEIMEGRRFVELDEPRLHQVEEDLLPDWTDDWLIVDRERLRQLRLHVLESLSEQLLARGAFGMALEAAMIALNADTLRESAHRAVMRVHVAEGNVLDARRAYAYCQALLRRELGVAPSAETLDLARRWSLERSAPAVPCRLR
ncbi:AfsR/SARP family transcriptional regulator [Zafaria sp. Z1313]|uniref:AfsR/SARP family transcriptional regulator n=1 Tax=unclassified Zafaria TaxID=2828765 RepID=UPI002E76DCE7|nr:BTAD domain-containing putative transcriptional regulator [Zafaria sp. J156]MEE1619784.1 BTAD domain-containing putative transcriptional regulator [Zafaria sp. J156]